MAGNSLVTIRISGNHEITDLVPTIQMRRAPSKLISRVDQQATNAASFSETSPERKSF